MIINGNTITKSGINYMIDGRPAYLARDGVSLVTATLEVLVVLTETEIAALRAEDEEIRATRSAAARKTSPASRISKERAFDRGYNECGEGYNPHRRGSAKTYR